MRDPKDIIRFVEDALTMRLSNYTFIDVINDTPGLTAKENNWAKQNLTYKVIEG